MSDVRLRAIITAEDQASRVLSTVGDRLRNLGQIAGGLISLHAVTDVVKDLTNSWEESARVASQLSAVLASTGDVSGVTASQADELSKSLQQVTVYSDETIGSVENMLLTFTNIGANIFPQATQAVLDMSTALGQDTKDSAIQLGKALQDPILGVTALRRVGVAFNEQQRHTIQNLVETGQGLTAQKMILKELTTEFGGSAQAMAKTFGGQLKILSNNLDDVKERMGQVIANALAPFVLGINDFVRNNGQLIASLGLATLAAGGFAAAVITIAGAIGIALTIIGGPFTIALLAISALLGVVVFGAVQKFQDKMKATAGSFSDNSKQMKTDGANNFGATGQAASDLADKLADIDAQMVKTTRDFKESLAQIVQDHQKKVIDLQKGLDQENKDFADAQASKAEDFKTSQDDMTRNHERTVADITAQLKQEQIVADGTNQDKIDSLQLRLAQENEDYNRQFTRNAQKYQEDVDKAKAAHEAKTLDFKQQLDTETALLTKHTADIASIRGVALLDEIDKLKRSQAEQMASYEDQKRKLIANAHQSASGMAGALNGVNSMIDPNALNGIGGQLGQNFAKNFAHNVLNSIQDFLAPLGNLLLSFDPLLPFKKGLGAVGNLFKSLHIPGFASGVENFEGGLAYVHQGEVLTNLPRGTSVIPRNEVQSISNASSQTVINISPHIGIYAGTEVEKRKLAKELFDSLKDVASKHNMTVADMLA